MTDSPCPCGLGAPYDRCCGRQHRGEAKAATAEQLMRARYSAYAVGDEAYLLRTWHPSTRPRHVELDPALRWTRLDVVATSGGALLDAEGTVEFRAHYRLAGTAGSLHERSRFARVAGAWLYVDAEPDGPVTRVR